MLAGGGREYSLPAFFMAGHGELAGKFPVEKQRFRLILKKTEHSELGNTGIFLCIQK